MESIIFELKIDDKNVELAYLRNHGLLFDKIRDILNISDSELTEISFEEYDILQKHRLKNDKS
ncbi:hypothetical protein AGMMS4957_03030 [Bacteroidia bacterium]|nr:hypothetical protein AGMMS4957_03030 [Bacteroidia bacterium]